MGAVVVLAAALAACATGAAVVAAIQLRRRTSRLTGAVQRASERLGPLVEELASEAAVTRVEAEQIQRRSRDQATP